MSSGLLSDVEARAQRRRMRTRADQLQELLQQTLDRAEASNDTADKIRWLERAMRLAPRDAGIALRLAGTVLHAGQSARAAGLFRDVAARFETPEAFLGLATAELLAGHLLAGREALTAALRRTVVTPTVRRLADRLAGDVGWCGIVGERLVARPTALQICIDGRPVQLARGGALPSDWRDGLSLEVNGPNGPLLGSPLPIRAFAVEGFVKAEDGGLAGWVWFPSDPGRVPEVTIKGERGSRIERALAGAKNVPLERPLSRPRQFALGAAQVEELGTTLVVSGVGQQALLGSPVNPSIEDRGDFLPRSVDRVRRRLPRRLPTRRRVSVVVPVHGGGEMMFACLRSALATVPRGVEIIVVDDATPDPVLRAALDKFAERRRIKLLRLPDNRGFPGACNAGMQAVVAQDIVVLNSDTLLPPGWLERLQEVAYSAPDIGTVTPLTNEGTIVSYPNVDGKNPVPTIAEVEALDRLAQQANGGDSIDLPVGVGFCMYLRRDFLEEAGSFREDLWAQGYGEENNLCLRGRVLGWRHVAAVGVFVGHIGGGTFGLAREHLIRRTTAVLERLHPGYEALVAGHVATDPLHAARRNIDTLRWNERRCRRGAIVMITHDNGGGVARLVAEWAGRAEAGGMRAVIIEPVRMRSGITGARVRDSGAVPVPNLMFAMPDEMGRLVRLLRGERVRHVEIHHMLGHHEAIAGLAERLSVEQISVVHDYARFCGRIALVGTGKRYCGEPDITGCEACIADLGSLLEDDPPVRTLVARSEEELRRSVRVVAPSADAAVRMSRHFSQIAPVVEPWENDGAIAPRSVSPARRVERVVVVGAIGVEKGYDVLLGCVRDARARELPIEFVVVGFTEDDERLMAAGPVFVTGEYREEDAIALVREQAGQIALIPSIWPETWCFALTCVWKAGLNAAVFDLGAQAERVRRTGRGWVLPLGFSAGAINETLLRLAPSLRA